MKAKSQRILFTEGPYGMDEVPPIVQRVFQAASLAARLAPPDMDRLRLRLLSGLRKEIWQRSYKPSEAELDRLEIFAENLLMHLSTGGMFKLLTPELVTELREPGLAQ